MEKRPTYEELEKRVHDLEQAVDKGWKDLQRIIDLLPVMLFAKDIEGRFLLVNKAAAQSFSLSVDELVGRLQTEIHPDQKKAAQMLADDRTVIESGEPLYVPYETVTESSGDVRYFQTIKVPYQSTQSDLPAILGVAMDVTERKRAEAALKSSGEMLQLVMDNIPQFIFWKDINSVYLGCNKNFAAAAGVESPEAIVGKTDYELAWKREEADFFREIDREVMDSDEAQYHIIEPQQRSDGKDTWLDTNKIPLHDADGHVVGILGTYEDITERKRAEEEKERLEAQLQQAQKMEALGTLAGGVAHDFNNLLMAISGRASLMLADKSATPPLVDHAHNIETYVRSASDLTRQLLGFARGGKYEVRPVDINDLLKNSAKMFARAKKEITTHVQCQKDVWPIEVDRTQTEQVFLNLFVNAWQAMPEGGDLYITSENVVLDDSYIKPFNIEPGHYVKISVADTGIGMDEQTQERIFDPFFTTKEMGRGTGLGLASVYGIVKNHGGLINVYSEEGKGTIFTVYFPTSEKPAQKTEPPRKELLMGVETVLLVDDEQIITTVGNEMLKKMGYTVLIANGGLEAIEVLESRGDDIDLVILDMVMPDLSGSETFDRLKAIKPDLRVLLSSGYSINGHAVEILDRGCDGFIQKPFGMMLLSEKIREILDS